MRPSSRSRRRAPPPVCEKHRGPTNNVSRIGMASCKNAVDIGYDASTSSCVSRMRPRLASRLGPAREFKPPSDDGSVPSVGGRRNTPCPSLIWICRTPQAKRTRSGFRGSFRIHLPVAAKIALATAGKIAQVGARRRLPAPPCSLPGAHRPLLPRSCAECGSRGSVLRGRHIDTCGSRAYNTHADSCCHRGATKRLHDTAVHSIVAALLTGLSALGSTAALAQAADPGVRHGRPGMD